MKKDSHYKLSLPDEWQKEDFTAYIALENEEKNCHGTPVSYTHLDVYKRQSHPLYRYLYLHLLFYTLQQSLRFTFDAE